MPLTSGKGRWGLALGSGPSGPSSSLSEVEEGPSLHLAPLAG